MDRLNGDFYRITWDAAIASNPPWIFITSWNEWQENTHMEQGKIYGDAYSHLTLEYSSKWKN